MPEADPARQPGPPGSAPAPPDPLPSGQAGRVLAALIIGQLGVHSAMAGLRLAAPLQALRDGHSAWAVGLLLALFAAAPVATALTAGRLADTWGYHRTVRLAAFISIGGGLMALATVFIDSPAGRFALLCAAAAATGAGTNTGMLTIQRTAGAAARDSLERVRIFSWLGVAPSFANVLGPVAVGLLIDAGGFGAAHALVLLLPLATLATARRVPRLPLRPVPAPRGLFGSWELLRAPGMARLLLVNWLLSMCWDVHTFAVPLLGHERGFSASTIGLVLGSFTLSVTLVRLAIPWLAHRLNELVVLRAAMLGCGLVFALYPLAHNPWLMGLCAVGLGLALGSVQPMVMSLLHELTPDERHGEALALRSMAINTSSTLMPLLFGAAGTLAGAGLLFWVVGALVASGAWPAKALAAHR